MSTKLTKSISNASEEDDKEVSNLIESFALMPQLMDKYESRFFGVNQSDLYRPAGMVVPKLPMYHPYHPFRRTNDIDDILQVPLAMILPNNDLAPQSLLDLITIGNIKVPVTPYFIAQTLPYQPETEVICRYQYGLFPEAKGEMKGNQAIWAQSFLYGKDNDVSQIPPTQIKIYESKKNEVSPTILCGNSMALDKVQNLRGTGLWSLVLGSYTGTLDDESQLFTEVSHAFLGFTYFIQDDDRYNNFLCSIRNKQPKDIMDIITNEYLS